MCSVRMHVHVYVHACVFECVFWRLEGEGVRVKESVRESVRLPGK